MGKHTEHKTRKSKSKKTKSSDQTRGQLAIGQSLQMMPFQAGGMYPQMPGLLPAAPSVLSPVQGRNDAPSGDSSSESSSSESEAAKKQIAGKGSIILLKAPRKRLQKIVERITGKKLDCITTADWSEKDMCRMIWILVRVKPSTLLSQFQAKSYAALYNSFATRAAGIASTMPGGALESEIDRMMILDSHLLRERAQVYKFDESWLEPVKSKAKSAQSALQHFKVQQLTQIEGVAQHTVTSAFAPPQGNAAITRSCSLVSQSEAVAMSTSQSNPQLLGGQCVKAVSIYGGQSSMLPSDAASHHMAASHQYCSEVPRPASVDAFVPTQAMVPMPKSFSAPHQEMVAVPAVFAKPEGFEGALAPTQGSAASAAVSASASTPGNMPTARSSLNSQPEMGGAPLIRSSPEGITGGLAPTQGSVPIASAPPDSPLAAVAPETPSADVRASAPALDNGPSADASGLDPTLAERIRRNRQEALAKRQRRLEPQTALGIGGEGVTQPVTVSAEGSNKTELAMCCVCREPLLAEEDKTALPCSHAFHTKCIQDWANMKNVPLHLSCPLQCPTKEAWTFEDEDDAPAASHEPASSSGGPIDVPDDIDKAVAAQLRKVELEMMLT